MESDVLLHQLYSRHLVLWSIQTRPPGQGTSKLVYRLDMIRVTVCKDIVEHEAVKVTALKMLLHLSSNKHMCPSTAILLSTACGIVSCCDSGKPGAPGHASIRVLGRARLAPSSGGCSRAHPCACTQIQTHAPAPAAGTCRSPAACRSCCDGVTPCMTCKATTGIRASDPGP